MKMIVDFLPLFGVIALGYVFWKNAWVSKQEEGTEKMSRIAKNIADGAMSFLKAEYKILSVFVLAVAVLLYFKGSSEEGSNGMVAVSFIVGAICSALASVVALFDCEATRPSRRLGPSPRRQRSGRRQRNLIQ